MPTTVIDEENLKQIRRPMDVYIRMQVPEDVTLSFSGYSGVKIYDDTLARQWEKVWQIWPMRKLADLQGGGFPLDGLHDLYDPATEASKINGKIGVRGNVGADVKITVTGSATIKNLTVTASGARSVSYGGKTFPLQSGRVIMPINAKTKTLTFSPLSSTERVEISSITPGMDFFITTDNLISATVSLRSDLSLFDQTLPESELTVEAYYDADMSELLSAIQEDTPITYQAGYDEVLSDVRKFYVSGDVTWADNVLSIHAVDAVHFLDNISFVAPVTGTNSLSGLVGAVAYPLERAGIPYNSDYNRAWDDPAYRWMIREGTPARDYIAFINQCFSITDANGDTLDGSCTLEDPMQVSYVDAGIPHISTSASNRGAFAIAEEDCGDVKRSSERKAGRVRYEWDKILNPEMSTGDKYAQKIGSATFLRGIGTSLSFEKYSHDWLIGLFLGNAVDNDVATKLMNKYGTVYGTYKTMPVVPTDSDGYYYGGTRAVNAALGFVGEKIAFGEIPQEEYRDFPDSSSKTIYSAFVPWGQSYDGWRYDTTTSHLITSASQMWGILAAAGVIQSDSESLDLEIYGCALNTTNQIITRTRPHAASNLLYEYQEMPIIGRIAAKNEDAETIEIYPQRALESPMYHSPITGSFTWKGDPRIQPRDKITFTRLDGTTEEITAETITTRHEGGGTTQEITYRKGVI